MRTSLKHTCTCIQRVRTKVPPHGGPPMLVKDLKVPQVLEADWTHPKAYLLLMLLLFNLLPLPSLII